MQTQKFTIFDFDKLQDTSKQETYHQIIKWATSEKNIYIQYTQSNYATRRADKMKSNIPISYYIHRANEFINRNWKTSPIGYVPLKTANEKMLFITTFVFPDNQQFMSSLNQYGIEKEVCLNFSEAIKELQAYKEQERKTLLEILMQEYFPNLDLIKIHYGTNNTGIIINKILEIAYLHPELLHAKEKS